MHAHADLDIDVDIDIDVVIGPIGYRSPSSPVAASVVFFVVHAVDDFDSGGEQGKELGSAPLTLRSRATAGKGRLQTAPRAMQVHVWRCAGVQVYRCAGVQVYRCTGVQV